MQKLFGRNILVLVPHADDEVVACSATIGHAQAAGSTLHALYLTHGCIAREIRWPWDQKHHDTHVARRENEARHAAKLLNIRPVGWSSRPARSLWQHMPEVSEEISAAVATHNIDQIWTPAYEGGNADHDVVNAITSRLTGKLSVMEFAEYNFAGQQAHSQAFPCPNGMETVISLTAEEKRFKSQLLAVYASERGNLGYVKTERECFRPLAPYDYSQPPHAGTLWYARFQWVPFRHPRVDFTDSAEVCRAISGFLASSPPLA